MNELERFTLKPVRLAVLFPPKTISKQEQNENGEEKKIIFAPRRLRDLFKDDDKLGSRKTLAHDRPLNDLKKKLVHPGNKKDLIKRKIYLSPHETKKQKLDNNVKKSLFVQPKNIRKEIPKNRKFIKKTRSHTNVSDPNDTIPLLNLEDEEKKAFDCKLFKSSLSIPNIVITPPVSINNIRISSNDEEFLELEQKCANDGSATNIPLNSPMTAVCSLMQNTTLIDGIRTNTQNMPTSKITIDKAIDNVQQIIEEAVQQHEAYQKMHQEYMHKMKNLLEQLQCIKRQEFSIPKRRSDRIASQKKESTARNITSPAITKSKDLRVQTLTKNFSKTAYTSPENNSKSKKALEMYNSVRKNHPILSTPKFSSAFNSPKSCKSVKSKLSKTLQKQCLLLQDTPK